MNETELLRSFRKERSEAAFAELVRRYAGLVYSVANRRLANAALAEDVTQIVFIRFAKTPPQVETPGELAAWLHRTTLNVAIDTWRSETRRRNREQQAVVMEPSTHSAWEDISPNLDEAVNQLNDDDRQAILLRFFGKKSMRDVGNVLGVSEAAAKMRVSRAVDRLRTQLGVGGIACTAVALGTLLTEHSLEAAPLPLVSRLAAMRLPKLATAGVIGGLIGELWQISKFKLAAGVAVVVLIGLVLTHFVRSSNAPVPIAASQGSADTAEANAQTPERVHSQSPFVAPAPKSPKIMFHVLDAETGVGLPQTKIHFVYFGAGGQTETHDTVTDENGDAPLQAPNDPTKDSSPNVFVAAEGHVPNLVSPTTNDYTMRLDAAITVGGFVTDEHNIPVPGVAIYVDRMGVKPELDKNVDFQNCPVTSHEDGSWTCAYIPKEYTNFIQFILKKSGYAVSFRGIYVPRGNLNNQVFVIKYGSTLTGKITDQSGRPIANARIKLLANNLRRESLTTFTDEDGVFTVVGVVNVADAKILGRDEWVADQVLRAELAVQADGFAPEVKTLQLTNATDVVNFALSPGNFFCGRVVDELGNPIPNVVVQTDYAYSGGGGTQREFDWTTHTDINGMFQWDSAPAEKTAYWFEADGYAAIHLSFVADGRGNTVTLRRLGAE